MQPESHPLRYLHDFLRRHQTPTATKKYSSLWQRGLGRKTRRVGLEQLEARRVLAAALWNSTILAEGESSEPQVFFYSPSVPGYVKSSNHSKLYVDDSDIVKLTILSNNQWRHELYFDGSDVGLSSAAENVDAFAIRSDGSLLFSTVGQAYVPGVTSAGEDLMLFRPTQLGAQTSGTWQMFFDGSDVGLSNWEGLDGVSELPDGRLIISTNRVAKVPGLSSSYQPEDLLAFTPTTTGNHTAGSWAHYFDGSDVHLSGSLENVDGVSVDNDGQTIHLSTFSLFCVPGLLGFGRDIFTFQAEQLGTHTRGRFDTPLTLNGSHRGMLFNSIDAIHVPSEPVTNQPPVIAAIVSPSIPELVPYALQLSASDPDTPASQLVWSLTSAPIGASLNATTGQFTWTPTEAQGPGTFPVIVSVTDGNQSAQATFTISVTEVNQAPAIRPIVSPTIDEGTTYNVLLQASDPDQPAQTLTWSLVSGPTGFVQNPTTGRIAWRPTEAQGPGVFPIVVSVSDGALSTQATFTITVREVNQPPVLAPIDNQTINRNQTLSLSAVASDPDLPAGTLTYSLVTAPTSATINPQTGQITWLANQTGAVPFTVQVTDQGGLSSTQSFQVNVVGFELRELENFATELVQSLTVPSDASALRIEFETPSFDNTSLRDIRDAFEIELMDARGNPLVLPYVGSTEASFNWTEGLIPIPATGVSTTIGSPGAASSVTINLSGLAAGTLIQMRLRLANNDSDNGTVVRIRSFDFVTASTARPNGATFASPDSPVGEINFASLQDVTGSFGVNYGRTTLAGANDRLLVDVSLQNEGSQTFRDPVLLVVKNLSSLDVNALRPDGLTPAGHPYFRMARSNGTLSTGQSSLVRQIGFLNSSNARFDYEVQVLAAVNSAPGNFVSTPLTSIEAGDVYRYAAQASDADGDALSYSIVSGPSTASIDSVTGQLTWTTTSGDVGLHRITIRATDTFGAFNEQTFDVQVSLTLQNRPPLFTSDPVTEAIASSGFEISTVATGNQPTGVSVISGFRGPRLVSINAGDQSVSVHAGQKNDRFDDTTVYSTGEPKPTGAAIDVGYTVDVGLPPFLVPSDRNDVVAMDQGDFNGDGILDLAVFTAQFESTKPAGQQRFVQIVRVLGDGDGNFGSPAVLASIAVTSLNTTQAKNLRVADIDGDGDMDVVALEEASSRLITVRGLGNGNFEPAVLTTLATSLNDFRLVDLDSDGDLDIVGRNGTQVDLGWMRGAGDGTFASFVRLAAGGGVFLSNNNARSYDFADIDGDGDIDIVNSESNGGNIVIWLNDGSENFTVGATIDPPGSGVEGAYVVHVADFTGDGRLDIFTINANNVNRVELFVRNSTGLSFTYQVGGNAFGRSGNLAGSDGPVDIDGDGDLDIILANNFSSEPIAPQVLINNGTGQFTRTDYPMADFPGHILATDNTNRDTVRGAMFGDYNRDGVMDFSYMTTTWTNFVGNYDFHGVGIRLGTRPGEFGATRTVSGIAFSAGANRDEEVHAADFNGDGKPDLLSLRNARMSLGNGDGTFQGSFPATTVLGGSALGIGVIADFNLDGILDYVAARGDGSNIAKIYTAIGNGDGTFASTLGPVVPGMFYSYSDIRTADFNNDGYPDLIAKGNVERFIDVYLNNPINPGTFTRPFRAVVEVTGVNATGFDHTIATGDFDRDGKVDFVTVDQVAGQPLKLQTFSGDGTGNFTITDESFAFNDAMFSEFNFYYPYVLQAGDVNSDGRLDVVSFGSLGVIVHIGNGDGSFISIDHYPIERINALAKAANLVDFDQDGNLDLVQHGLDETLSVRLGKGDGTFAEPQRVGTHGQGSILTFADFDNDGHLDIATVMKQAGNYAPGDVVFYYGTRNGLVDQLAIDLDGDGNEEVLAINDANDRLKIFAGDNLDRLTRRNDLLTGRAPQAVATGDLNSDGRLEIITANRTGRSISVFRGSLASGYISSEILVGSAPIDVLTRDINGDGHTDVLVLDDVANAVWVLSGSASGALSAPVSIALGDKPGKFTVVDATGDGQLDAVITLLESNRLMILPRIGVQPASPPIYVSVSDSPGDIQVTDLNADGNPDLATTLSGSNVLSVLYGRGNNQFARAQNIAVGKEPTRVTLADADEDGRMDLIVANSGDNTASVIYNRFDPNEVYRYDSDAIDPDNDTLTYSIVDGPGGLIINSQTGALLWAASPDQVGEHSVTISAADGRGGMATQSFKIDVQPARDNAAPLIATEPNTKLGAGETFTYQATALDNDRDTLRYSLIDAPPGATIDPTTGKVTWDARADMALSFAPYGSANGINNRGRVEIEAHPSLQPTSLTAEGWYNFTSLPASNQRTNIISSGIATSTGTTYSLYNFGNAFLRLEVDYPSPTATFTYSIPFVPTVDRWMHFAVTIDDSTRAAKIYVDGVERGSTTLPSPLVYNPTANALVGDSGLNFTRAIIDNYRLWNVVRTPAEIIEGLSRQYDAEPRLVLDYRFDEPQTQTVRDFSPAGNHGYRKAGGILPVFVPGLAETGRHQFTIGVEDGRGGFDQQTFTLDILPELRGSIRGQAFDDLDSSGARNGSEPVRPGVHLFIDTNNNGYPDPSESQTTTDTSGNYQFNALLPGNYPVRVTPVAGYDMPAANNVSVTANTNSVVDLALEQLDLGQIRGQLRTTDLDPISYWKVFADLDVDGVLDENEPVAASDRAGNYALSGLTAGTYTIRAELPAGWSVASGITGQNVTLSANAISLNNNFNLVATNTSVTGGLRFVTSPALNIEARQTYRYSSVAIGIHQESIKYDLSLAPEGMSIDPATGLVAWRPSIAQVGEQLVVLRATSGSGSITLQDFTVTVTAPNTAPVLTTSLPGSAYVGLVYAVNLAAQDAESQVVSYQLLSAPATATLNTSTGQLRWTPTLADVGTAAFSIEVRDSSGSTSVVNANVQVVNVQPAATPYQITLPRTLVGLGQAYLAQVTGHDALGRPLSWSLTSGPTGLLVSSDGTLRWTPGNDDLGTQAITLRATDVDGGTTTRSFDLQVVGRPVKVAPVIASTPIASTVLGSLYQYDVAAVDADADPLAYALLDAPIGMSIHPSLGTIRWTPAADQLGENDVSVQVTDPEGASVIQAFKLKVSRSGGPPAITSIPPTEAAVGVSYLYTIAARDAENDPLVYRLLAAPAGMTIIPTTGVISWTPLAIQLGEQDVVIEVSDGIGGAVTQAFAIRVAAGVPNLPPVINTTAPRFGSVGAAYSYTLQATDPESTALTYSLGRGPVGMTINATSGQVSWTPAVGQTGKFVVTLIATDAGGASAIESFELDVLATNSLPTIISTAPLSVPAGALFTYQVIARDADLDQLSYALTISPAGASIDSFGKITWPTTVPLIGSHNFTVRVSDPRGGVATQAFTLSVIEDVVPPKVSLIESLGDANRNILPWQGPFIVYARAIDNVAVASLTLTANGQDIPLSAAGTATFTFEDWAFQQINATATAVDTNGNITTRTISFDYDFPEGWSGAGTADIPTVAITSPTDTAAVFGMVAINGTASHANFAGYKLSYRRIDETTYTQFFESTTAVVNGQLGVWDTSLLINDEYVIRLEAASNTGVVNVVEHNVGLSGELKLGNFQLSFTDMVIPVAGIPIEITRIYDTLQADREGDFGYGWRLEYRNTDLRVGLPKSGLEDIGIYSPLRPGVKVYLNVPGVGRQGFTFNPDIRVLPGFGGNNLVLARPRFTPDRGVTSTLATGTSGYLQVNERGELFAPGGIPYNPASPDFGGAYVLTTREGVRYRIDGQGDLTSVTDTNDNTLTFSDAGVTGPGGAGIAFERDAQGRITAAVDPLDNSVRYSYSASGDLTRVDDREGNVTSFGYRTDRAHYLDAVIDPLGRTGLRSEYDANGRLIGVLGGGNEGLTFSYDPGNQVVTTRDGLNRPTTFEYDNEGRVVASTDALGNTTRITYDVAGNTLSVTDPIGRTMRMTYDARNNQTSITDPTGAITRTTFDAQNNPLTVVDPLGNTTSLTYDNVGNVTSMIDASGNIARLGYARDGRLTSLNAAGGLSLGVGYGSAGPISGTDWNGLSGSIEYDANGRPLTRSTSGDGRTFTTSTTYDAEGRILAQTDESGAVTSFEYDAADQLLATVSPLGERTTYGYDGSGRVVEVTRPDGLKLRTAFDAAGQVLSQTDASGRITRFEYDAAGRLIATLFPDSTPLDDTDNPRVQAEYDAAGQVVATIDELGRRTTFTYDSAGRRTSTTDPLGRTVRKQYDAAGRVTSEFDPLNRVTTYSFDATGRSTGIRFADNSRVTTDINDRNFPAAITNELSHVTRFEYAPDGQIAAVIDPLGNRTGYEYDTRGKLVSQTDARGNVTRFEYDANGQQTTRQLPGGQRWQTAYNVAGQVIQTTDPDNRQVGYAYDSLGRISSKTVSDGVVVSYSYTPTGQLASISEARGITRYEYDARDRLTRKIEPDGQAINYEYDAAGQLVRRTTSTGAVRFTYDAAGQLTFVTDETGGVTQYTFDGAGQLVRTTYPNAVIEERSYDLRGRITRLTASGPTGVLTDFRYTLDAAGRIVFASELGRSLAYNYDAANRLISETTTDVSGTTVVQYEYDSVGNRMRRTENGTILSYEYDTNDRLTRQNNAGQVTDFTYDASGNQTSAVTGLDRIEYTWDGQRRLVSARVTTGGVARTQSYLYDDAGVRVGVTNAEGNETRYLVDTNGPLSIVLAEYTPTGTVIASRTGAVELRGGTASMLLSDRLGSVRVITNGVGSAVSSFDYDAYGQLVASAGTSISLVGYAGEPRDALTGLDYLRARSYDPSTGRFVSADPFVGVLANPLSRHRYQYADLNPVSNTDPTGMFTLKEILTVQNIKTVIKTSTTFQTLNKVRKHAKEYAGMAETIIIFGAATAMTTVYAGAFGFFGSEIARGLGNPNALIGSYSEEWTAKLSVGLIDKLGVALEKTATSWALGISLQFKRFEGQKSTLAAGLKMVPGDVQFTGEAGIGFTAKYNTIEGLVTETSFAPVDGTGIDLVGITFAGKISGEGSLKNSTAVINPKLGIELKALGLFKFELDIIPGLYNPISVKFS